MASPSATPNPKPVKPAIPPTPLVKLTREQVDLEQYLDRYIAGKLELRQKQQLEQFCRDNPKYLDEVQLSARMHAGLKLIESAGRPEPWNEEKKWFWLTHWFAGAVTAVALVGLVTALVLNGRANRLQRQLTQARQDLIAQPLLPASSSRTVSLVPASRVPSSPMATIGGGARAEYIIFSLDLHRSDYSLFDFEIERADQGRVTQIYNLRKDSNGFVRWAVNSSALGPGFYTVAINGRNWRGQPVRAGGIAFSVAPRE
jgi:hypothetical protein